MTQEQVRALLGEPDETAAGLEKTDGIDLATSPCF
jgi:hypothetical protein